MDNKRKIRTAVIGLGVGAHQARTLSAHPNCQLVWLCDLNQNKLSELGSELTEAKQTQNEQDVLEDPNIDMVCVASYDEAHHRQVMRALNHGKHVYVEKPICLTKNEAQDIRLTLKAHPHLRLSSNMVLRTCPLFIKVRETVKSQKIGKIYHLEADYFWGRKEKIISGWRAEANLYSIIHGAAVHMVDLAMWIIGKKPVTVQALGSHIATAGTLQQHNDFAVLLLRFEDHMSVKVSAHGGCMHPHFHSLKVFGEYSSFIHESTGTVWIDSSNPNQTYRSESAAYPAKKERSGALISFLDSLSNFDKKSLISDDEVFNTMSVCLAAEQAVKTGRVINIEYL
ncbi:Gfo/Idh/MocA family oxidoreductase [Candidatus Pelagibacter sp.]|nr:Gfo/Idh/MocA family oxidoreductase [Candidatus Pelagibacter sp.]